MARIVFAGGGACGLLAAMLLADDGHDVVVLERDAQPAPAPSEAWDTWERRGVNQFRLPHGLLPRFRIDADVVLPRVVERLVAEGAFEANMLGPGGPERFRGVTAKRPFAEACFALEAEATPGLQIRRGVSVTELIAGPEAQRGVPHVSGVVLDTGERLMADLVVDSGGRRSALPRWLDRLGARPPIEEKEDSGFVYYGTHYQSHDGAQHATGPVMRTFGSVSVLALAAETGTWGVGLITASDDKELRVLKDKQRWLRVMALMPDSDHLIDGEPLHEIRVMSSIEDRYRRYVVDGAPVATGVVAIADAVAATNPTRGRGIAMGLMHGIGLRELIDKVGLDDPLGFAEQFDEFTDEAITPQYRDSLWGDRHRIADVSRARQAEPAPEDPQWRRWKQFMFIAGASGPGPLLELVLDNVLMFKTSAELLAAPEVCDALEAAGDFDLPDLGPSRAELLSVATA